MTDQRRLDAIQGLRDLADFLESQPLLPVPAYNTLNMSAGSKEDLALYARLCSWEKDYSGEYFSLRKRFKGPLLLDIYLPREEVCRKVVVGTEVVPAREAEPEHTIEKYEWICDESILHGGETNIVRDFNPEAGDRIIP
jgi:hypothetical protein